MAKLLTNEFAVSDSPDPATSGPEGEHRPFGLKYFRGKLYLGLVLSGQDAAGEVVSPVITVNGQRVGENYRSWLHTRP
ncbi:MAG: hypothetical protein R2778_13770 [Saprospiraceae bacterium]